VFPGGTNSEGQAVRLVACVGLLTICLGLAGCSLTGKKAQARDGQGAPAAGASRPHDQPASPAPPTPPPNLGGIIAGQVVDGFNRSPRAKIEVITSGPGADGAPVIQVVHTNEQGYFTILGVTPGQPYQLIARAQDGTALLTGATWVRPPDAKVVIRVSEDFSPPPPPGPPATIEAPTAVPPGGTGTRPPAEIGTPVTPAPTPRVRPDTIVEVPGPGPWQPRNVTPPSPPRPPAPTPGGASLAPTGVTPVPSCQLTGTQLVNFALADLDGQPWEFRRDRKGKLVLLDFWSTTCIPCQAAMSHLVAWNNVYGPQGLQIVGIAYEREPTFQEQARKVRGVCNRKGVNYRTLMGSGPSCPVKTQFDISYVPTLVLIDETGRIVWRNTNPDQPLEQQLRELEIEIKKGLARR
jgi:thiol-disulfide isomerase/thioredoxin